MRAKLIFSQLPGIAMLLFLASLKKGSAFTFEQSKINEEVWLPSSLEAHVNARLLLLKGMEGNFIERYSDYKKFRVESMTKQGTVKEN